MCTKRGEILHNDLSKTQYECARGEFPVCESCGALLSEYRHDGDIECYTWWCNTPECREEQWGNLSDDEPRHAMTDDVLRNFGIPKRYYGASIDAIDDDAVKEACMSFPTDGYCGLLLQGRLGSGKTYIAVATAKHAYQTTGQSIYFANETSLLDAIKQSISHDEPHDIDGLLNADMLILDDVGAQRSTDYDKRVLYNIINTRYNNLKKTIITTNLKLYGDKHGVVYLYNTHAHVASRLQEYNAVIVNSKDRRRGGQ